MTASVLDVTPLLGTQVPRILCLPESAEPSQLLGVREAVARASTGLEYIPATPIGQEIADVADLAGLVLDSWQKLTLDVGSLTTPDSYYNEFTGRYEPKWAALEMGTTVSRQNGKGSIIEARELGGLFVLGERLLTHTAHQFDTSKEGFDRIMFLIENCPDLDREVARVTRGHGEEGLTLKSGQRLRFRTRTKGGGRGFTGDCLFFDEDMYATAEQVAATMPILSARPNPQMWCLGSAGNRLSTHKGKLRQRAINGGEDMLGYTEWSAELCTRMCPANCTKHDDPRADETIAKTNPAAGLRITWEYLRAERNAMSREMHAQERLGSGQYPVDGDGWLVVDQPSWLRQVDLDSEIVGRFVVAVATAPDSSWTSIITYGANDGDMEHAEVTATPDGTYDHRAGSQWAIDRIVHLWNTHKPVAVIVDKGTQTGDLIAALEAKGVRVESPSSREYAQSCGAVFEAVVPPEGSDATLVHLDQEPLNRALAGVDKRPILGGWAWIPCPGVVITPIQAVTLGKWGFKQFVKTSKPAVSPWIYRR